MRKLNLSRNIKIQIYAVSQALISSLWLCFSLLLLRTYNFWLDESINSFLIVFVLAGNYFYNHTKYKRLYK